MTFGARFATLTQVDMPARIEIRQATPQDATVVREILTGAAQWLEQTGKPQWRENELSPAAIAADVAAGLFYLAEVYLAEVYLAEVHLAESSGDAAGTVKFQLEDSLFWPDLPSPDAAYIHRLAVRRRYAGARSCKEVNSRRENPRCERSQRVSYTKFRRGVGVTPNHATALVWPNKRARSAVDGGNPNGRLADRVCIRCGPERHYKPMVI